MAWFKRTRTAVRKMTDMDGIKRQQSFLFRMAKSMFKIDKEAKDPCEFKDLASRGITDKKLKSTLNTFTWLYRFFGGVGILLMLYTLALVYKEAYFGALVSFAASFLFLAHAFKYHFWAFQIRTQKLGCTFGEWFNYITGGKGSL